MLLSCLLQWVLTHVAGGLTGAPTTSILFPSATEVSLSSARAYHEDVPPSCTAVEIKICNCSSSTDPRSVVCYLSLRHALRSPGKFWDLWRFILPFLLRLEGIRPHTQQQVTLLTKTFHIRNKSSMRGNQTNASCGCEVHTLGENSCHCSKLVTVLFKGLGRTWKPGSTMIYSILTALLFLWCVFYFTCIFLYITLD